MAILIFFLCHWYLSLFVQTFFLHRYSAHGMFTMGLTAKILTDWFGPAAIRSYGVRFTRQVWPGDRLETSATVVAVDGNELTVELETRNQRDEVVLTGDALVTVTSDATDSP